jgi:hypothetical protein
MIWWLVDFGRAYYVGEVLIVGRKDCCWERMHNLQIRIGNLGGASSLLNSQCGELHSLWKPQHVASLSVQCDGYGQYLTIAKDGSVTDISLSEVAAFQIENGKSIAGLKGTVSPAERSVKKCKHFQRVAKLYGSLCNKRWTN